MRDKLSRGMFTREQWRDVEAIKTKVIVVLWPVAGTDRAPLREWDLWVGLRPL
jgi:hypothetical protein